MANRKAKTRRVTVITSNGHRYVWTLPMLGMDLKQLKVMLPKHGYRIVTAR
jgi:hypothetical protein